MNNSSIAVYLNIVYHLIVGCYYSLFWSESDGTGNKTYTLKGAQSMLQVCAQLMNGTYEGAVDMGEIALDNEQSLREAREAPRVMEDESSLYEDGKAPLSAANNYDVLAMGVLYAFYYIGELVLVTCQTVIIMYLRRSRLILGLPNLKFWIFGLMYYNCSGPSSEILDND